MASTLHQCSQCDEEFETLQLLERHNNEAHPMAPVPGDPDDDPADLSDEMEGRSEDAGARPDGERPDRGGVNKTRHPY